MASSQYHIIFVCTTADDFIIPNKPTGLWLDELASPYYTFQQLGYTCHIVKARKGKPIAVDSGSYHNESLTSDVTAFLGDSDAQSKLKNALSIEEILSNGDFDMNSVNACYLCGGHGCLFDYLSNTYLTKLIEYVYNTNKGAVAAICHGVIGIIDAIDGSTGKKLLDNKFCTCFSDEEEEILGLRESITMSAERALDEADATLFVGAPWTAKAIVDKRLITGQNPQSSIETAARVLDVLRSLGDKFSSPLNVNKPWGS